MKTILMLFVFALMLAACAQPQSDSEKPLANPEGTPTNVQEAGLNMQLESPIYFVRDSNIYQINARGGDERKITDYPSNPKQTSAKDREGKEIPFNAIRYFAPLSSELIGYGACATVTGNYGCSIFAINKDQETRLPVNFSSRANLQTGAFYDHDTFAYAFEEGTEEGRGTWRIILRDGEKTTTLLSYAYSERFGRGGSFDDARLMKFSPNAAYIMHIDTASPRNTLDYNISIYPSNGLSAITIANATQPAWIDNQTIVYKSLPTDGNKGGVYTYSIGTKQSSPLLPSTSSLNTAAMNWPRVAPDGQHVSFFDYNQQMVYIVNLQTKQIVAEIKNAVESQWIDNNTITYAKTGGCSDGVCGQLTYSYRGNAIYSLESKQSQDTHNLGLDIFAVTTMWNK